MALIYVKQTPDTRYEVRTAGASLRLYSNGVLHSQYNPNHPISGAIWDLLLLPGFFLKTPPKRILVLGLGGGTVVHLLRHFFPLSDITCVELDKEHIHIAQQFFKIPAKNTRLVHGDAYDFLKSEGEQKNEKYDWIIDDVFQHLSGEPKREKTFSEIFNLYLSALSHDGLLSLNVIADRQYSQLRPLSINFKHAYVLRHPLYVNRVVSLLNDGADLKEFKTKLSAINELDNRRKSCRLQYSVKKL